ncbi:MAG: methyltransferase domain-containing protein [Deltaproteobacteria bacterium]|nr:methyltransferase domain-containing protein [Deltaproteobacteria bacterium]
MRNFDFSAPLYDLGLWFLMLPFGGEENLRKAVIEAAMPLKGLSVLELCAGTASLSFMAAKEGAKVTALDVSSGMLRVAREKAGRLGLSTRLVRGDVLRLPFPDNAFDMAIVSLGLHEVEQTGVPLILREVHRVLKTGSRFVIFDFHKAAGWAGFLQSLFFTFGEGETGRTWLKTDVQTLLREAGFKDFRRSFMLKGAAQLISVSKAQKASLQEIRRGER